MSNTLTNLIPTIYEALDTVSRELVGFVGAVSRDSGADRAAKDQTIRSFVAPTATTADITPGDVPADAGDQTIGYVDMAITKSKVSPVRWEGEEQRSVEGQYRAILRDQFTQSMRALVNEVEEDLAKLYLAASRAYGTSGTTPFGSDLGCAAESRKILVDNGAPQSDLNLVLDTAAGAKLRTLGQLSKANEAGGDDLLRRGVLLDLYGVAIRESGQSQSHTKGTGTSYQTNNSAGYAAGATTIAIDTGSGTVKAGDVVTFAADTVNKYVVKTGTNAAGNIVLADPGLRMTIPDNNAMTILNNYTANMAFHRSAIHLVTRAPAMPDGGDASTDVMEVQDPKSGLAFQVAIYRQYRRIKYEVGMAWGVKCIKPEHTCILLG